MYRIINSFIDNGMKSRSVIELTRVCGGNFKYDNYNHWDLGRHAKYHIIYRVGNKWKLRDEVLQALNL